MAPLALVQYFYESGSLNGPQMENMMKMGILTHKACFMQIRLFQLIHFEMQKQANLWLIFDV